MYFYAVGGKSGDGNADIVSCSETGMQGSKIKMAEKRQIFVRSDTGGDAADSHKRRPPTYCCIAMLYKPGPACLICIVAVIEWS